MPKRSTTIAQTDVAARHRTLNNERTVRIPREMLREAVGGGMGQRRVLMAIASLLAAIALVVAGCGGSQPDSEPTGTDNEETAPPEAQDVIITGLETMFTWFPARDSSTLDAYDRALPFLGQALRDGANNRVERGNSVWWQEWKAKKAEVTADALLVAAEHPEDKPDTVQRAVTLTQTVKTPDGKELDKSTFQIERVVAKKGPQGWRVEEINFFPENEYRTQICPPGQSHQPPPDGPCAPNPPPPPKQCPDGTTVPADQVCPPSPTGPQTKQCPDGTTVPAGTACPGPTPPQTKECPDGSTIPADQTCPTGPPSTQCPDGTTVAPGETCPTPTTCPDGMTVAPGETCPTPTTCPDGMTVAPGETCPAPTQCPDGSTVPAGQTCPTTGPTPCPDGTTVAPGETCPTPTTCPDGSTAPPGGTCPSPLILPPPPPTTKTCIFQGEPITVRIDQPCPKLN